MDQPAGDHDDVVRRSFTRQVGLFSGPDSPFARRPATANSWLEPLGPDLVVLDVACGAAHVAETVAPHVRQVVGVDLTRELLDLGARRLADAGIDNVLLQTGSALDLPFVDDSFDLVCSRSALHHLTDPARAVAEMGRVCRPGGRVVVSDMTPPEPAVRDAFDAVHRRVDPSHVGVRTEEELASLVATLGPLSYGETTEPIRIPVEILFTELSDRAFVVDALDTELAGGPPTGFEPEAGDDGVTVAFRATVVHATVGPRP
jgi:SAM-dependent methyltransferase